MSRKKQLWFLIILSALTAVAQYATQGYLAIGSNPHDLPSWFRTAEAALWGLRAFVESVVVVYLFQTATDDDARQRNLALLEVALIALIALTLGPALRAVGYGRTMLDTWGEPVFSLWNFGIAAYAPLMIGGAAYAYKCQPDDSSARVVKAEQLRELEQAQRERDEALALVDAARAAIESVDAFKALSATAAARVIASQCDNGNRPSTGELAALLDVSASTVSRGYRRAGEGDR